jgi:hypothetical protein
MRLGRLAIVWLKTPTSELQSWAFDVGDVHIKTQPAPAFGADGKSALIVMAEVALDRLPQLDENRRIVVPAAERQACEKGIGALADILGITHKSARQIASLLPCIAFIPQDAAETDWLERSDGVQVLPMRSIPGVGGLRQLELDHVTSLGDRLDGVRLLAEAISQRSVSGQYRDLVRFFEAAFTLPFTQLAKKLSQFLSTGVLKYSRQEIEKWASLRHGITHGDRKVTVHLLFEEEVWPYIARMFDTAYDVLLNKSEWGNSSRSRRDCWKPRTYVEENGTVVFTQGDKVTLLQRMYDDYGVYPLAFKGLQLPQGWWYRRSAADE